MISTTPLHSGNKNHQEPVEQPLVSVIMNCHNGEKYLREAIDSVFAQSYEQWEIIFYDNSSTDRSGEIARSYGDKLRYFRSDEKLSLGAARNKAISNAAGQFLAVLDTDDQWLSEKLMDQVGLFTENADVGFVYSNYYLLNDATGKQSIGLHGLKPEGDVFASFLGYYPVNLQTVMIRASSLQELDEIFDPVLEYAEEYDLFMRLLYHTKAKYQNQPTAIYRVHSSMLTHKLLDLRPREMEYCLEKLKKNFPGLDQRYPDAIKLYSAKVSFFRAVAYMASGNRSSAREALTPYKVFNFGFFAFYCATFFPRFVWQTMMRLREKTK